MNNIVAVTVRPQGSAAPCIKRIRAFYPDLPIEELNANLTDILEETEKKIFELLKNRGSGVVPWRGLRRCPPKN